MGAEMGRKQEALATVFDRLAAGYDAWYQTPLGALSDDLEKEAVLSLADPWPGAYALDVSCGTGNYALALARRGARVVAVDPSERMLEIARSKATRERLSIEFHLGTAEDLPFASDAFDLVTAILMLEFSTSPEKALSEMLRVLKRGGRLVIGVLGRYNLWAIARRFKSLFVPSIWREARFFSRRRLAALLVSAGGHYFQWKSAIYFPPVDSGWLLSRFQAFEGIGQRAFPDLGAFLAVGATR